MELTKTKEHLKMAEEDITRLEDENAVSSMGVCNYESSKILLLTICYQLNVLCIVFKSSGCFP